MKLYTLALAAVLMSAAVMGCPFRDPNYRPTYAPPFSLVFTAPEPLNQTENSTASLGGTWKLVGDKWVKTGGEDYVRVRWLEFMLELRK